jgi:hypothetical protein
LIWELLQTNRDLKGAADVPGRLDNGRIALAMGFVWTMTEATFISRDCAH